MNKEVLEEFRAWMVSCTGEPVTEDEALEALRNLAEFFVILAKWNEPLKSNRRTRSK